MNKYIYTCIAVMVIGLTSVWYFKSDSNSISKDTDASLAETSSPKASGFSEMDVPSGPGHNTLSEKKTETAIPQELKERMEAINIRRPNLKIDAETLQAKIAQTSAWSNTDTVPTHLPLKPEEFTDGRHFISVDDLKIETLMPGDKLDINIPDTNNTHEVVIDTVEKHDYNSISWYGHIVGADGQTYSVSMTRGDTLTVGGFDTPDGHYVIQGQGKDGWIASSALLFKEHVDPIRPEDANNPQAHVHTDSHEQSIVFAPLF